MRLQTGAVSKQNKTKKRWLAIWEGGRHTSSSLLTTPSSILPVIPEAGGVKSLTIWHPLKAQRWGIRPNRPEMEINDGHLSLQDFAGVFVIHLTKSSCDFGPEQWRKNGKCSTSLLSSPAWRYITLLFGQKGASVHGCKPLPMNSFSFVWPDFKSSRCYSNTSHKVGAYWPRDDYTEPDVLSFSPILTRTVC